MNQVPSPQFLPQKLHDLYGIWQNKRDGRALPSRSSFVLRDLTSWLGNLALLERIYGNDYRFRVCGTGLIDRFGCDATNRSVESLPEEVRGNLTDRLDHASSAREPMTVRLDIARPHGVTSYAELILPLAPAFPNTGAINGATDPAEMSTQPRDLAAVAQLFLAAYRIHSAP